MKYTHLLIKTYLLTVSMTRILSTSWMHIVPTHIDTERAARGWEAASTGESLLPASDIPLWQHRAKPRMDRMAGPLSIRYSRARREGWDRRGGGGGGEDAGHQAATLAQVGGAEVIHFKGKINDTINPCLGHCRGGRGRTHTRCWAT